MFIEEEADMRSLIDESKNAPDEVMRDHFNSLIGLILSKNPQHSEEVMKDMAIDHLLMEIMKDRVNERVNIAVTEAVANAVINNTRETKIDAIKSLMNSTKWSVDKAMESLNIPQDQRSTYAELVQKSLQA